MPSPTLGAGHCRRVQRKREIRDTRREALPHTVSSDLSGRPTNLNYRICDCSVYALRLYCGRCLWRSPLHSSLGAENCKHLARPAQRSATPKRREEARPRGGGPQGASSSHSRAIGDAHAASQSPLPQPAQGLTADGLLAGTVHPARRGSNAPDADAANLQVWPEQTFWKLCSSGRLCNSAIPACGNSWTAPIIDGARAFWKHGYWPGRRRSLSTAAIWLPTILTMASAWPGSFRQFPVSHRLERVRRPNRCSSLATAAPTRRRARAPSERAFQ